MKNPNDQSNPAHKHFTATDRKVAKNKHKNYKKNHPEAYAQKRQELLSKVVDLFVSTKYPTFEAKLTITT